MSPERSAESDRSAVALPSPFFGSAVYAEISAEHAAENDEDTD